MTQSPVRKPRQGLLLLNLGTPEQPTPFFVKKYLKEFLMDPLVIDIPFLFRWLLVNVGILPKRSFSSALAYEKVWTEKGSPLLFHLRDLVSKVQASLGTDWKVEGGMRYGEPALKHAIGKLIESGVQELYILPLYPQYSSAATESSIRECKRVLTGETKKSGLTYQFLPAFYHHPSFIESYAQQIETTLASFQSDHLLFSFHGLPERQIHKLGPSYASHCDFSAQCCEKITRTNENCYRAQCYVTARLIAEKLKIHPEDYTVCFQSRLGRTPWIRPYTDELYRELPKRGVRRLAVACPSFVSDCLETLEEVQIRGREEFLQHGGQELKLIPSLNSSETWVQSVCQIVKETIKPTEFTKEIF